jgi:AbrB family looped-hinge helix DNA binding protein
MHHASVTVKGQVTIPAPIRQKFSLDRGGKVVFSVEGDKIILNPLHESVEDAFGLVKSKRGVSPAQMKEAIRQRGSK